MQKAVSYARVSSKEQEQGFSLESQVKTARNYSVSNAFNIVKEFTFSESAKQQGRKHFNAMLDYLRQHTEIRIVIVEKMDRLCRNLNDFVLVESLVEELGLEVHLVKDGQILRKESKSQEKLVQGLFALLARNYIQNLQEEILKGQQVKADKGQYPGRAAFGYSHDRESRTIVAHPTRADVVRLIFRLYSSGRYSVAELRRAILEQTGERISKSQLHKILKSRFYLGFFTWRGREYHAIHPPLVDLITFERVQDIVSGRSKAKPRKHFFPFSGILHCAEDDCAITAEIHKGKYIYYRCTYGRGKHKFPLVREEKLADMLGMLLKQVEIRMDVAQAVADSTRRDRTGDEAKRRDEISKLNQRISAFETRKQKAYEDKLDGEIDDEFFRTRMEDWSAQQRQLRAVATARASEAMCEDHSLSVERVVELAKRAHSIYATRTDAEGAQLLKKVLLNCTTDGANVNPTYRQPFNLIFGTSRNDEWCNVTSPALSVSKVLDHERRSSSLLTFDAMGHGIEERTQRPSL
jgi:DNA invertase Pin-like site-specific DNA recombinase